MIGGAVSGSGGPRLGRHNAAPQENGYARLGSSRGLMSEGIAEQTRELTEEAQASGHKAPLRHAWASPPPGAEFGEKEWDAYWTLYERAQGLQGCAYSEAIHDKPGADGRPPHRHRVYLALTERGTLVRSGWDYAKQETISRVMEFDTGQALTKGKHNKHAARIATDLGRADVAAAMEAAGLMLGPPAIAGLSPAQRAQQERTGIAKADVARALMEAWKASDSGTAFMAALRERGLRLATGTKKDSVPVIVDAGGNTHGLRQMLGMAAREAGQPSPRKAAIDAFLAGATLPSLAEVRADQRIAATLPAEPTIPEAAPVHDYETAVPAPDAGAAATVSVQAPAPEGLHASTPVPSPFAVPVAQASPVSSAKSGGGDGAPATADGGGGAMLEDVGDAPGPLKPNASPEERAKHIAAWAAYQERKAAAWKQWIVAWELSRPKKALTSASGGGHDHGHFQQQAQAADEAMRQLFDRCQQRWDRACTVADLRVAIEWFEAEADRIHVAANIIPAPGSVPIAEHRNDGAASGGAAARDGHDSPDARTCGGSRVPAYGPYLSPGGGGAARGGRPDSGGDGDGGEPSPHGGAPASYGSQARQALAAAAATARLARALAAVPSPAMERLRSATAALHPATAAMARIQADRARIASVLAGHPHPDSDDRKAEAREKAEEHTARQEHAARKAVEAETAAATAYAALTQRSPLTWLRNVALGSLTPTQACLADLADLAARSVGTRPDDDTLRAARERGRLYALAARERTASWEARPAVVEAAEQARLNGLVELAADADDPAVLHALQAGDPDGARLVIQAREEEERQQAEELERSQGMQRGPGGPATPGMR